MSTAAAAERDAVLAAYDGTMSAGTVWHVIDSDWLHQWAAYVGIDLTTRQPVQPTDSSPPSLIPNERLRDPSHPTIEVLRPHILEGSDYELVPHAVAELLFQRYATPSTPRFARSVIEVGTLAKEQRVDVWPAVLTLVPLSDSGEERDSDAEVITYASNTKWSEIRDMLLNADRGNGIYDEEKEDGGTEGKPKMRFWLEKPAEEHKDTSTASTALSSAASSATSSSSSSSYIADPFRSASSMLKGGEGPLTENSSAFDLSSHAAATAVSSSSSQQPPESASSSVRQYVLLSENDMMQSVDAYLTAPLSRVLVDKLLPSGHYSRSSEPASFRNFSIGDKLDAKDTIQKWYVSNVRDVKDGKVFIHFNNWDTKWDEWIETDSDRLAPLHTHTMPPPKLSSSSSSSSLSSYSPYSSSSYSFSSYNSNEEGTPNPSGAVGLRNLGNTCFMNSILQSMAHCPILTTYFLSSAYLKEINRTNPLGWNGRIAEEYGSLLQQYWSNRYTVIAPRAFKQALGEFQPRFSGYQQHDSQELLSFLLDGLHEDLNRVIKKPATQGVESAGRDDEAVAKEAWDVYKLRNQSVVVDHMMGQLKSRVVCPQPGCGRVSITFDPYCTLSLPLPTVNDHMQTLFVVYADSTRPITRVNVVTSKVAPLSELRASLSIATGVPAQRFVLADVWAHRLYRVLDEDSSVSDIRPADLIYAYELPALDHIKPADVVLAQLIHQKVSQDSTSLLYGSRMRQEVFGLPRVMALSKKDMVTGKQIAAEIDRLMEGWVKEADDEVEGAAAMDGEQQVEGQPSSGLDMLLDATVKEVEGQTAAANSGGGGASEMETNEHAEGELEGETQMEGEEGRDRDRDSGQSSTESTDSNGYVIVKSPQDDAIMTSGEGEGEGVEGDTAVDADGVRSVSSSPPPADSSPDSTSGDPSHAYRIVQLDSDGRHCLRCPLSSHCTGCALPIDDETMQLPSNSSSSSYSSYSYSSFDRSEPKLVFGIEWTERSARRYNDAKEAVDTPTTDSSSNLSSNDEHRVNLADCLAAFCKEETLSEQDPWYCSHCKDFRCASKKMDLFSLPDVLILHLKRFAYTSRSREKISTLVHFPIQGLDLSHINGRPGEGRGGIYDLFAVSNHMGGLGGGHYTAYVRNRVAGGWYLHDDSRVSEVSEDEIVSSSAYVLFYRRRGVDDGAEAEGRAAGGETGREGARSGEDGVRGEDVDGAGGADGRDGYTQLDADGVPKSGGLIHDHFAMDGVKRQAGGDVEG